MVLEVAQFDITAGQEEDFASAYKTARQLLADTPGCRSVRMTRGIETPTRFILLVEWDSVEAHEVNFRQSPSFPEWRRLIGPYFASTPLVEHYADILGRP
jgi:heme-degrading monooxygenase HmoA